MTTHLRSVALLLAVCLAPALWAGCKSKSGGGAPESVAQAFADAMASGNLAKAADQWNYITEARAQNENWDDIPSGQRSQIIGKLKESKQADLEALKGGFASGMKAGPAQVAGTSATVQVTGGPQGDVTLQLEQADGVWGVTAVTVSGAIP
jgi:hypothetical protein